MRVLRFILGIAELLICPVLLVWSSIEGIWKRKYNRCQ